MNAEELRDEEGAEQAIADDQPMTAGAYVLSKMMPIWRKVELLPTPVP